MAVKIRLKRMGKIRDPRYRVVVVDSRKKRDGRVIEEVGIYQPTENPSLIRITSERVQYWLGVGAQPSETVLALLKVTGDWQKFKGLPGAEGTLQQPESKAAFVAEDKGSVIIPEAITPKAEKTEDSAESEDAPAETAEAEAEKAE
ncbi:MULTISPECIES: 30S ribosomal protein S16 [Kocuria]|uniref:Small ribosomal subunit protein bS16 n=1 Tax=Kocuria palustris PEL TaxID=1236550 RepID=M2XAR6_9MICC|nr:MULTISPECIES: 30S ribosomal protein S16 [Kocuria]ALB02964.1 30S ribosomal protein S16 [Kocuria palustris]EME36181.1 SSU ribosomal protein S16p [Kocuria palustris PEL]KUG54879.1 30S ribosomal protein S16 [Kocuria palustris]MBN6752256.1 30S ribosomal protein S16 [Kocuria palustris]MBN6757211.1 30S ribosomal protein S16 [Kocuria palustris]